ncbi:MAG TPA: 30S ribosomal protein S20 [Candidatus Paceibacterota bacterium]|jgi:small subunit ribosomal protein S20|nr:30S ribosomal protein S20 [Candidatus Paceibacterota bacterium]HRZ29765.1 30S ribosomal protein S20 [Candidatus Paceibacterota bacterium]
MPIIKSAKKALRQSKRRNERNVAYKVKIHKIKKTIQKNVIAKEADKAKNDLKTFYKAVDKAAKRNVIHKNKANRLKSRLAKKIKSL